MRKLMNLFGSWPIKPIKMTTITNEKKILFVLSPPRLKLMMDSPRLRLIVLKWHELLLGSNCHQECSQQENQEYPQQKKRTYQPHASLQPKPHTTIADDQRSPQDQQAHMTKTLQALGAAIPEF
jgi:hypothetical protein